MKQVRLEDDVVEAIWAGVRSRVVSRTYNRVDVVVIEIRAQMRSVWGQIRDEILGRQSRQIGP